MKQFLLSLITLSTITWIEAQNLTAEQLSIFSENGGNRGPLLVEVTTKGGGSIGYVEKCGEGSKDTHKCVPYYQCDGKTGLIILDGSTNGSKVINIRIDVDPVCAHFLDVCCRKPPGFDGSSPSVTDQPTPGSTSTQPPPPPPPPVSTEPTVGPTRPPPGSCGIRNDNGIDFKLTGNSENEAEYGEFPWMVAILRKQVDPSKNETLAICGGSIIAPNVILTGGHCVADLQPNQYKVRAGEWDTQTEKERVPYQERDVVQAVIHEKFDPEVVFNDIALLILSSPFNEADNVGSLCLPGQDEVITSKNCYVTGWGKDKFGKQGKYSVILKKIELAMVQHKPCEEALRRTRLGQVFNLDSSFICAGGDLGKDACTGDGGSPLVCPDPKNPTRYVQSGVVSWGIGCGEKDVPGVYANVPKYRNWVDTQLLRLNINTNSYA